MSSYITVSNLAGEIWEELGQPSSLSSSSIETKLLSSGYLGKLDILIDGNHFIDYDYINSGYCFEPEINKPEQAIYKQQYLTDYYYKRANEPLSLDNGMTAATWTNISEGDSKITRSSPVEYAKYYKSMGKESREILIALIDWYKRNKSSPQAIDYFTISNEGIYNNRINRYGGYMP